MIRRRPLLLLAAYLLCQAASAFLPIQLPPSTAGPAFGRRTQFLSTPSAITEPRGETTTIEDIALQDPVILFDGVCNFCNTWVDVLLRIDMNAKFNFAPLQSEVGRNLLSKIGKEADDISSVVLVQPDLQYYDKSACVLKVVEELGPVAAVASKSAEAVLPQPIRDSIYDTVAENRYNFLGKRDECRCGDPQYADRFLA